MGFGHRVYRAEDPRARVLRRTAREIGAPRLEVAEALEEAALAELKARKPDRVLATNVEFWSAVVLDFAGVPPDLFTPMFACARVAGWSAHILEQKREGRLIRPTAEYVGPGPRSVGPTSSRDSVAGRRGLMEAATTEQDTPPVARRLVVRQVAVPRRDPRGARLPVSEARRGRAGQDPRSSSRRRASSARATTRARSRRTAGSATTRSRELGERGLIGLYVPERVRRRRGSRRPATAACSRSSRRSTRRCRVVMGVHQSIGMKGIVLFGTDEQKERFLPDLATGRKLAAFALTEPNAGSDAAQHRVARGRAARRLMGAERREALHRQRLARARVFVTFARAEVGGEDRHIALIVERGHGGLRGRRALRHDGPARQRPPPPLLQRRARARRRTCSASPARASRSPCTILNNGRLSLGTGSVGGAKWLLDRSIDHVKERRQFGTPLADFELVQDKIGWMVSYLFGLESMAYLTTGLVDAGRARLLARVGDLQGLRHRVPLVRGQPRAAARGRRGLHARRALREDAARHPHLPDLRGRQRRDARLHRAVRA